MATRFSDYSPYWQIRTRIYPYHPVRLVTVKLYCEVHVQLQAYSNSRAQRTSPWLQLAAVCIQAVTVVTCCSLLPDSHRGYNLLRSVSSHRGYKLLQSAASQSSWLQLAAVCCQTVILVTTCCSLCLGSHRGYNLLQSVSRHSPWLKLSHLP